MIQFDQVSKRYPTGFEALRQLSFQISDREMVFLTGHSGAGKSTLLKLIMLMERPSQGQVFVDGYNLQGLGQRRIPFLRRNIGIVLQDHRLLFDRSVFDNVALSLIVCGYHGKEISRRVSAALDKVGLLSRQRANPITLSTGEQQRVGIARAVVNKPRLLLADEPTGNLDPQLALDIMNLFKQFNEVDVTVLIATHDLALVEQMGKRTLSLHEGELVTDQPSRP